MWERDDGKGCGKGIMGRDVGKGRRDGIWQRDDRKGCRKEMTGRDVGKG